jgi:hypothetical protein
LIAKVLPGAAHIRQRLTYIAFLDRVDIQLARFPDTSSQTPIASFSVTVVPPPIFKASPTTVDWEAKTFASTISSMKVKSRVFSIAIDRDRSILQQQMEKVVKRHIRPLAGAIDGKIAQRNGGHAIVLPIQIAQMFRRQLDTPYGDSGFREGILTHRQGRNITVDRGG